jgi:hypothetical protein
MNNNYKFYSNKIYLICCVNNLNHQLITNSLYTNKIINQLFNQTPMSNEMIYNFVALKESLQSKFLVTNL